MENARHYPMELVYAQYIKPLSYHDRVVIVQRILQDFIIEQKNDVISKVDKLKNLRRFKGIAAHNDYALIHTFKENILIIEPINQIKKSENVETEDFDWDNLINEIHQNRQNNNIKLNSKINQLLTE